jgi:hypothetical protein
MMDEGTRSTIKTAALQTLKRGPMTREQLAREAKVTSAHWSSCSETSSKRDW